jgi:hypothetical protein
MHSGRLFWVLRIYAWMDGRGVSRCYVPGLLLGSLCDTMSRALFYITAVRLRRIYLSR